MTIKATVSDITFQEHAPPTDYQGIETTTSEDAAAKLGYRYFWETSWSGASGTFRTYWDYRGRASDDLPTG